MRRQFKRLSPPPFQLWYIADLLDLWIYIFFSRFKFVVVGFTSFLDQIEYPRPKKKTTYNWQLNFTTKIDKWKDRFGYTYFIIADLIIKIPISVF